MRQGFPQAALLLLGWVMGIGTGAAATLAAGATPGVVKSVFGKTPDGTEVALYTFRNSHGMEVSITPWGATVTAIRVPDRQGKAADVVLGFDSLAGYLGTDPYFGASIGRYGNRIAKGSFKLDGNTYTLARNDGENHLHGGKQGFDKRLWTARELPKPAAGLELRYVSADGEEGYPGALSVTVTYTLTETNELRIDYRATTDKPTVLNLTNHSYFNLAGGGDVLGHQVQINASRFTPVDSGLIPTGELRGVKGTPFDFTAPHAIGERINASDEQLRFGKGYDHNWVLDGASGAIRLAARVSEPTSGRVMEVLTTEPALQLYTGNFLDGSVHGKGGRAYAYRGAMCLESQHYPDSPNHPAFPTTTLRPGQTYSSTTIYRFSTAPQ
jgi:aldose 1-epimerase